MKIVVGDPISDRIAEYGDPISDRIAEYCNDLMWREPRTTSALSLDRFPPNFPRTRVQVVARDTWFHIPEKFPLRDRICRKTLFLAYRGLFVISLRVTGNVLRRLHFFHPLVDIPQMCLSKATFAEGCTVFQVSTSESVIISNGHTWMGTQSRHLG